MKKIITLFAAAAALVSCNLDFYRSDTMTSAMLGANPGAAVYTTDGNYSMFKDRVDYSNTRSGNNYDRLYLLMNELRGDNVALSGRTTDPLYQNNTYTDDPTLADLSYFWYNSYKIIYSCNSNIESMVEGTSVDTDHLIGENYCLRALCHLNLVTLYATPYTRGAEKPGIVVRTSTDCSVTERTTVGDAFNQIVSDLEAAARLMEKGTRRGNAGFVSYNTARGLLTRVHLYMGNYDAAIEVAEAMFEGNAAKNLDSDIVNLYSNTKNSTETLFCIGKIGTADPDYSPKSQIASMYYSPDSIGGTGWCEMYWSDPLMQLIFRHPEDKRLAMWGTIGATNDGAVMVHWPIVDPANRFRLNANVNNIKNFDKDAAENKITYDGKTYTVKRTTERTGYPEYYIENLLDVADDNDGFLGPKQTQVYVRDNVGIAQGIRQTFPAYTMAKFSNQDGDPMLASPALIRWGEVVLNAAEAYAHKGDEANALKYVNVIRTRAGIPTWTNMAAAKAEGYTELLDVVLDERRMELCFEGLRTLDLYRNGKPMDRRFAGVHDWEIIDMEGMDFRYPYCIPFEETSVSGIAGNGKNY